MPLKGAGEGLKKAAPALHGIRRGGSLMQGLQPGA